MMLIRNKQAMAISFLAKALLAIVVLVIISSIFFIGDDSQFGKIKELIPRLNSETNPKDYGNPDYEFASDEEKGILVFDELVQGLRVLSEDKQSNNCFYFLPQTLPYDTLDSDIWIRIESGSRTANGNSKIYLEAPIEKIDKYIKKGELYSQTGAPKRSAEIPANLCLIHGSSGREFTDLLLPKNNGVHTYSPAPGTYEPIDQLILEHRRAYIDGYKVKIDFKETDYRLGLVKIDNNNICLMLTEGWRAPNSLPLKGASAKLITSDIRTSANNFFDMDIFEAGDIVDYERQFTTWYKEYNACFDTEGLLKYIDALDCQRDPNLAKCHQMNP